MIFVILLTPFLFPSSLLLKYMIRIFDYKREKELYIRRDSVNLFNRAQLFLVHIIAYVYFVITFILPIALVHERV